MSNNISFRQLSKIARKINLKPNTLLLIKHDTPLADGADILANNISATGIENVIIAVVDDLEDVSALDEKFMNEHGWYRIESLKKIVLRNED